MGADRFDEISTHWSALRRAPREALEHVYRVYRGAIVSYFAGRVARGDFPALRGQDAEDLVQDFFIRLAKTGWVSRPDPAKGRFRPFFIGKIQYYLRERAAAARESAAIRRPSIPLEDPGGPPSPDPLEGRLEAEWREATVRDCLSRIRRRNAGWHLVLDRDLERDGATDREIAVRLGWTEDRFKATLKRARVVFRVAYRSAERRLDRLDEDVSEGSAA